MSQQPALAGSICAPRFAPKSQKKVSPRFQAGDPRLQSKSRLCMHSYLFEEVENSYYHVPKSLTQLTRRASGALDGKKLCDWPVVCYILIPSRGRGYGQWGFNKGFGGVPLFKPAGSKGRCHYVKSDLYTTTCRFKLSRR